MKKFNAYLGIASVLSLVAIHLSQTACWFWSYQPKTPKCLTK